MFLLNIILKLVKKSLNIIQNLKLINLAFLFL